jgi:hypothetical protein
MGFAMETHKSRLSRSLFLSLVALYLLTIALFVYPMLASEPNFTEWWMISLNLLILSIPLLLLYGAIYYWSGAGINDPLLGM